MPTFSQVRETYYEASGTTSELSRKLGFAAIAFIWLFSGGGTADARQVRIEDAFNLPALLLVVSLGLDLVQYLWRTAAFGVWTWHIERAGTVKDGDDVFVPRGLNWPTLGLFWTKITFMTLAYVLLASELYNRLS